MSLTKVTYSMIQGAVINVKDYGAIGNGVADDTAAIQAAINANKNGTIFFPIGAYNISSTLKIEYTSIGIVSTNLIGEGLGSTLLWRGGNTTSMIWYEAVNALVGFYSKTRIENLNFVNESNATGLICIRLGNVSGPLGVNAGIQNVTIRGNRFTKFDFSFQSEYESDGIVIDDNVFLEYGLYGIRNTGSGAIRITNNYFQAGTAGSNAIYSEYASLTISGNLIQSSNIVAGGIVLSSAAAFTITTNYFEFPIGSNYAILISDSSSGYIGESAFNGMQGADIIYIKGSSTNIVIGANGYAYFASSANSLIRTADTTNQIRVIGQQHFSVGSPPVTPFLGGGYSFVIQDAYLNLGPTIYTGAPWPGITMANTGVINIGNNAESTGWGFVSFHRSGVNLGSIQQSGTTGVNYGSVSDYRLKEVIGAVSGAGDRIDLLEPIEYTWKSDNSRTRGFLAHKFQEVYPGSVIGAKDAVDADGDPVYQAMQASTPEVIADLVVEMQSLRKRIAILEAK